MTAEASLHEHGFTQLEKHLQSTITSGGRDALCTEVVPTLIQCIGQIAEKLREAQKVSLAGTANAFGDDQLNVDVLAEQIIREGLAKCPAIKTASSEEDPQEVAAGTDASASQTLESYTVAFDPLDGSSIIAPNWTVGTIIGVWDGDSALHKDPSTSQIASILGVYGPRTTAVVAIRLPKTQGTCFELGITDTDSGTTCEVIRPSIRLSSPPFKTRYFAPANLRAASEDERYMKLVTRYIEDRYTLRYSGGLVPDLVHALVKGHGVYISPVTAKSKAKLRRLYELAPVALIVECAGGQAIDPVTGKRILEHVVDDCDERAGIACGNVEEVERVREAFGLGIGS